MNDITGKVCVVTGAAKSIGFGIAKRWTERGAKVALLDIDPAVLDSAQLLANEGAMAKGYTLDITDSDEVKRVFETIRADLGPVYALVNNAGAAHQAPIEETTTADWEKMMAVNVYGSFYCIQAAIGDMKAAKKGKIVNFSSKSGKTGSALMAPYSSAKGAVIAMTQAIAYEVAPYNINVNCVCPGITDATGVWNFVSDGYIQNLHMPKDQVVDKFTGKVPLGRLAAIEDIVDYVDFLTCSGDYCTGQALNISGGREMH